MKHPSILSLKSSYEFWVKPAMKMLFRFNDSDSDLFLYNIVSWILPCI